LDEGTNFVYIGAMTRLLVPLLLFCAVAAWAGPSPVPALVQIKQASLYAKPSSIAKFLGRLSYGTKLAVVATKDDWAQVEVPGQGLSGWVRTQAFTTKALDLKAGDQAAAPSATEVSLAGRGFTEGVETQYKQDNPGLNFAVLDLMESQGIDPGDLDDFVREGGLKPQADRK
jgi:hypothetical protein